MALKITFQYTHRFTSPKKREDVYNFLVDYEKSIVPMFPGLKSIQPKGNDEYVWDFETIKQGGYEVDIDLVTKFSAEPNKLSVLPVKGKTMLASDFTLTESGEGTTLDFKSNFETELALPSFLKSMAQPFAEKGIRSLFVKYLSNVEKALK